jgi:hypothetical protein
MFQDNMIGFANMGMRIACNPMERGFEIGGRWRYGSPELHAARSVHGQGSGLPTLSLGEPS